MSANVTAATLVVERDGEEKRLSINPSTVGFDPNEKPGPGVCAVDIKEDRIASRSLTDLDKARRRAYRVYESKTIRDAQPCTLPDDLSCVACAENFEIVLKLDPEGLSLRGDPRVTPKTPPRAVLCYDTACMWSMAANEALERQGRQGKELTEKYSQSAIERLDESLRLGWSDFDHLNGDSDLDPIRKRPDFKRLMEEYSPKPRPGG